MDAYEYLVSRDYDDELEAIGVTEKKHLTTATVQTLIDNYCAEDGYLYERNTLSKHHFDFGYDMGFAQGLLSAAKEEAL